MDDNLSLIIAILYVFYTFGLLRLNFGFKAERINNKSRLILAFVLMSFSTLLYIFLAEVAPNVMSDIVNFEYYAMLKLLSIIVMILSIALFILRVIRYLVDPYDL